MPPNSEDTNNHDGGDNPSPPPPPLQSYFQPQPPPPPAAAAMTQPPLLPPTAVGSGCVAYSTPTPYDPKYGYNNNTQNNPTTNLWGAMVPVGGFQQQQIPGHVVITNNSSGDDNGMSDNDNGSLVSGMTMPVYSGHQPAAVAVGIMPVPVHIPAAHQVIPSQTVRYSKCVHMNMNIILCVSSCI